MKNSEEKVQEVIDNADKAFNKPGYPSSNMLYLKENARCEFLKVHLKAALETIEHMASMIKAEDEFHKNVHILKPWQ